MTGRHERVRLWPSLPAYRLLTRNAADFHGIHESLSVLVVDK